MEPGALLFVTFVAIGGFGLLWFRIQEAMGRKPKMPDLWEQRIVRNTQAFGDAIMSRGDADPRYPSQSFGNVHSEASEDVPEDDLEWVAEGIDLTKEEWLAFLAKSNMFDSEGLPQPFTKAKLAALVGVRAEDANKVIDVARGVELRPKPAAPKIDPRYPELTNRGRVVSSALKQGK
jgi:hypothetical protein